MKPTRYCLAALLLLVTVTTAVAAISFSEPNELAVGQLPTAVTSADLNGDSILDLIVVNRTTDDAYVYFGDGSGGFQFFQSFAVGSGSSFPTDLAIADFDEDGNLDVVTSNAQSGDNSIGLILGDGDGTFSVPTAFPTTCTRPESIAAGDFDRDEHVDVAAVCFFSSDVVVMLGNDSGGFAIPQLYSLLPDGIWLLVREVLEAGTGSYDAFSGNLVDSRDAGISASGFDCP